MSAGPAAPSLSSIARYDGSIPYIASVFEMPSFAPSTSFVRMIGMPATMRGAGLPASLAAFVSFGAMWLSIVFGPVIHRIVPSLYSPARRSITSPSAAITRPGFDASGTSSWPVTLYCSPSNLVGSPRSSGVSTSRYSRMCFAGLS